MTQLRVQTGPESSVKGGAGLRIMAPLGVQLELPGNSFLPFLSFPPPPFYFSLSLFSSSSNNPSPFLPSCTLTPANTILFSFSPFSMLDVGEMDGPQNTLSLSLPTIEPDSSSCTAVEVNFSSVYHQQKSCAPLINEGNERGLPKPSKDDTITAWQYEVWLTVTAWLLRL